MSYCWLFASFCLIVMVQAAKLDPHFDETFVLLGKYYEQIVHDLQ